MIQILLILHILLALSLVGLILLQKGKGASMGAAFGSGASQTVFGSKGSFGFMMKLTVAIAALFFITTISLTYFASRTVRAKPEDTLLSNVKQLSKMANQKPADTKKVVAKKATSKKAAVVKKQPAKRLPRKG